MFGKTEAKVAECVPTRRRCGRVQNRAEEKDIREACREEGVRIWRDNQKHFMETGAGSLSARRC